MNYPIVGNLNDIMGWDDNMTTDEYVNRLKELGDRDRAIRPEHKFDDSFYCPLCHRFVYRGPGTRANFCPHCGQRLKWEDET